MKLGHGQRNKKNLSHSKLDTKQKAVKKTKQRFSLPNRIKESEELVLEFW